MREAAFAFSALCLMAWYMWPKPLPPVNAEIASLATTSDSSTPWQYNNYKITPQKPFDISARILATKTYSHDRESQLAPFDLALGWGPMSDPENLKHLSISQNGRFYYISWGGHCPLKRNEIFGNSSNCHVIPANEDILAAIKSLKVGDTVQLQGFIVRADASDGWHWSNSTSWDSGEGAHACKVIWVEKVDVK